MSVSSSLVCYQVDVSATGRSLVQRSPTKCSVSECDCKFSITRLWPYRGCCTMGKKSVSIVRQIYCWLFKRLTNFVSATSISVCRLYLIALKLEQPLFYNVAFVLFLGL